VILDSFIIACLGESVEFFGVGEFLKGSVKAGGGRDDVFVVAFFSKVSKFLDVAGEAGGGLVDVVFEFKADGGQVEALGVALKVEEARVVRKPYTMTVFHQFVDDLEANLSPVSLRALLMLCVGDQTGIPQHLDQFRSLLLQFGHFVVRDCLDDAIFVQKAQFVGLPGQSIVDLDSCVPVVVCLGFGFLFVQHAVRLDVLANCLNHRDPLHGFC
jgi:hypothetical protein